LHSKLTLRSTVASTLAQHAGKTMSWICRGFGGAVVKAAQAQWSRRASPR
jgi:hypothetical protein